MAKGVSSKTHSRKQLNDYANQHNPNNKAYQARVANNQKQTESRNKAHAAKVAAKRQAEFDHKLGLDANLDWMCYSNPYDFD